MMIRSPAVLSNRSPIIFLYSGEAYHASAASREGNSIITTRGCFHSPSNNVRPPPRATNFPPKASIVAGTAFRYSANMDSSLTVSAAITKALITIFVEWFQCVRPHTRKPHPQKAPATGNQVSDSHHSHVRHFKQQAQEFLLSLVELFSAAAAGHGRRHDHQTTVDHALMRGLVTAGPVMRRGASSV